MVTVGDPGKKFMGFLATPIQLKLLKISFFFFLNIIMCEPGFGFSGKMTQTRVKQTWYVRP